MANKIQNYAQKVDFGLTYMKFAVVMETSKMIETPLTYQNFRKR